MAKVLVRKSDLDDLYVASADDFQIKIERGENHAPRSVDLLLFGLGACTISTVAHYMSRKGLPLDSLAVELSADLDEKENVYRDMTIKLQVDDRIPPEARTIILSIAKNCRIHRTLERSPRISLELAEPVAASVSSDPKAVAS